MNLGYHSRFEMNNSNDNQMVSVKTAAKELNISKRKVQDLIKQNLIDWTLENGTYLVDIHSIKEEDTFDNVVVIPKFIKKIFSATYKDFATNPIVKGSDTCKLFKRVSKDNTLNIMDAFYVLQYCYEFALLYQSSENIHYEELLNNPYSEYQKIYAEAQRRSKINPYDPRVIFAEHFIMLCFIKSNFSIIEIGSDKFDWLMR